ncbi:protein shisa-5-like isoform X2 [Triplophysa rosa]|uniref:protein shisa-5-like isoform X2 n=1 Tax=Triplophysa rosa TaxID=992332 RepID=UPI0025462846|nr:protein shisa-5-like isoform X2 [Triplophysa rosa]
MASPAAVFSILFAVLFAVTSADYACSFHSTSSGENKLTVICAYPVQWNVRFCCGTCDDRYCCSDPQKKLSKEAQKNCFSKIFENLIKPPPKSDDDVTTIAIIATIVGLIVFSVLFLVCWVCPCCILYKKCRNPTPMMGTHFLPQQIVINGGLYPPFQPLPNNLEYGTQPVPTGPFQGQPCVPRPPPPYQYQEAGYPVPNTQPPYISDQHPVYPPAPSGVAQNQVPTDYTPPPAFNPVYVESSKTSY